MKPCASIHEAALPADLCLALEQSGAGTVGQLLAMPFEKIEPIVPWPRRRNFLFDVIHQIGQQPAWMVPMLRKHAAGWARTDVAAGPPSWARPFTDPYAHMEMGMMARAITDLARDGIAVYMTMGTKCGQHGIVLWRERIRGKATR